MYFSPTKFPPPLIDLALVFHPSIAALSKAFKYILYDGSEDPFVAPMLNRL